MNTDELKTILDRHARWLAGGADGMRANLAGVNLAGVNLAGANLVRANLVRANLADVNLAGANLTRADLTDVSLAGANLTRADLTDVSLAGANLVGANLADTNLTGANVVRANLADTNLMGANLARANLENIKKDLYEVLDSAPAEATGLLDALRDGKIDGSCYEGKCACLVGTIANLRGMSVSNLVGIWPNFRRPAERWFLGIKPGHTPENNPISAITAKWIEAWIAQ